MKIGLIDVDGNGRFPNLPLMKLSAWHKKLGDSVEWYSRMFSGQQDRVYMSKVFTFTEDYPYHVDAKEIVKSGTGYFYPGGGSKLREEIEHIYPDYSLYPLIEKNTAYGFLTRGCPCNCDFCIVPEKEGVKSYKVADLEEFWRGQKNIKLMDPNLIACKDHMDLLQQLIDSKASVDFTQGVSAKFLTEENAELLKQVTVKRIHFAWDKHEDEKAIIPKLKVFKELTGWDRRDMVVYVLTNYGTSFEQDLDRIYKLKEIGYDPDVRIYNKGEFFDKRGRLKPNLHKRFTQEQIEHAVTCQNLQRWVNNKILWNTNETYEEYITGTRAGRRKAN